MRTGTFHLNVGVYETSEGSLDIKSGTYSGEIVANHNNTSNVYIDSLGMELINVPNKNITNFIDEDDIGEDEIFHGKPQWS